RELDCRVRGVDGRAGERIKAGLEKLTNHKIRLGKAGECSLLDIFKATAEMKRTAASLAAVRRKLIRSLENEAGGADLNLALDLQAQPPSLSDVANALASANQALAASVALLAALTGTSPERLESLGSEVAAAVARCPGVQHAEIQPPDGLRKLAVLAEGVVSRSIASHQLHRGPILLAFGRIQ
ncbi:MAG: hypothetical protein NT154_42205, partial [Verrucomicrobia bacterium]|nr:hypothetical protein [Verrucomicrobiota bacterium]